METAHLVTHFSVFSRVLLALSLALPACPAAAHTSPADRADRPLIVFAAASLKTALDEIAAAWQRESGQLVRVSYAGTPALARQIEQGAPADVFLSADRAWMDYLAQRGLVVAPVALLSNRLVLVAPRDSGAGLRLGPDAALSVALGDGRLAVAQVDAVPAGRYAKAALGSLGLWDQVADRLVQASDVRGALRLVARGEAPLGIVYATDAQAEPLVRIVDVFDASTHPPILYLAATVNESPDGRGAAFVAFLADSATAHDAFARQGFTVLAAGRE